MLTEGSGYRNRRGRQISFSKPIDNYRSGSGSKQDSPSIAVESVAQLYREKNRTFSPLHNLHYKYLPHNYISPEKKEVKYHQKQNQQSEAINSKIKNLLSSIDQEEKRKEIYNQKYYNKAENENASRYSYNNYENTPKRYQNPNDSVYKKSSLQKTIQQPQRYTTPLRDKNTFNGVLRQKQYCISSIKQAQQNAASYKENLIPPKPTYLKTSFPHKQQILHTSSYSNINSRYLEYSASRIKRQKQSDQNSSILQTNKNVDNQIAKLQKKIQQLQQMKVEVCSNNQQRQNMKSIDQLTVHAISNATEKINLQQSNSRSSIYMPKGQINPRTLSQQEFEIRKNGGDYNGHKSSNILYQKLSYSEHKIENKIDDIASFKSSMFSSMLNTKTPIQLSKNSESILKESETQLIKSLGQSDTNSQLNSQNSKVSNEDIGIPKILQKLATKRKKAQNKAQITNVVIPNSSGSSVSQFLNTNTQTPMSIETRRQYINHIKAKDLQNAVSSLTQFQAKNQISRFLSNIKNQILIDQDLRKVKKWFLRNRYQFKWRDLQVLLRKNHLYFDEKTMRNTFSMASQEQNPFYEPKQGQYTLEHLVSHYERAQKHWAESIVKNYNKQKLQKAGFSQQSIDIAKKGTISIEDLVRYVNFELDTYYRNRDIYVIFHRLKKTEELRFIDIIKCLAHY